MDIKGTYKPSAKSGDEIVISGIADRFPDSDNMISYKKIFSIKLISLERIMVTYQSGAIGTINNLGKFDADFFEFSVEQAHACDPMLRMLLEHSYEAVIDAGINPKQLRGKNTAVIIGVAFNETQKKLLYQDLQIEKIIDKYIVINFLTISYTYT
ncbi:hypothetical protein P5V15_011508 [Pogonomyrmex californicus]